LATNRTVVLGVVKNGLVVPRGDAALPEGAIVEISCPPEIPADLRAELASWELAGEEAWAMIDEWEREG
jgi:hypothetical protein